MSKEPVHLSLRSTGERTTPAAEHALRTAFESAPFDQIALSPLSTALEHMLQRAVAAESGWTISCDADVVVSPPLLRAALEMAGALPHDYFVLTFTVDDWLFGNNRTLGVRIYRNTHANRALDCLHTACDPRRPESTMIRHLCEAGLRSAVSSFRLGVHDRYQWHHDLYRKGYFFAHKHVPRLPGLVDRWRSMSHTDDDFRAALLGLSDGLMGPDSGADSSVFDSDLITERLRSIGLTEKDPLTSGGATAIVSQVSDNLANSSGAPLWRTEPFPTDLVGQWQEFRRGGVRFAVQEIRSLYDRLGYRHLPDSFIQSLRLRAVPRSRVARQEQPR